jgi:SAM-dependent methyltransferase
MSLPSPNTTSTTDGHSRAWGVLFAVTVLSSAFLIFQVQPLVSKYILPWFGGTPAVWSACLLFFQVTLFCGYAYAHFLTEHCSPRRQVLVHGIVLGLALLLLPIAPDAAWKPTGHEAPLPRILGLLAVCVGLPYFALSATGPLLQRWYSLALPGRSPYRLYALSNVGSLAGLLSYPFLVEPTWDAATQAAGWSWAFGAYAVLAVICGLTLPRHDARRPTEVSSDTSTPAFVDRAVWFGLAAMASILLLATTNQVCTDVAVMPFLWVLPLTLYLVSFILCFDGDGWYPRRTYLVAGAAGVACVCVMMFHWETASLTAQVVVYFAALFFGCMVCHGELARLRPAPRHLTGYYLAMSAGGACGGILTALVAPLAFSRYLELHIGLFGAVAIVLVVLARDRAWTAGWRRPAMVWSVMLVGVVFLARTLRAHAGEVIAGEIDVSRNFYGVLKVARIDQDEPARASTVLVHGHILHGRQFTGPGRARIPTAYYGEQTAAGLLLAGHSTSQRRLRVGVVGLGVGTLAVYGRPGDVYRCYEINPDVIRVAERHFTYLRDSAAKIEIVTGDARLSLEREPEQNFDVLILDAFSSDAIPTHLLTREAFAIYARHLAPGGCVAAHISNRHFDLKPVLAGIATERGWNVAAHLSHDVPERGQTAAEWILTGPDRGLLHVCPDLKDCSAGRRVLWTDQSSHVLGILK